MAGTLAEREAELAAIDAAIGEARAGAGSVLLIEGPAGIGKTALAGAARARAEGMRVLYGGGTELERAFPFGVARQLLEPVVRRDSDRERLLQGAAKLAEPVLLGAPEGVEAAPLGLLHGLYWLVASLADETPLAIVVDDAHWADEPSLRFLVYLGRRVDSLRVAVLVGARPDEDPSGILAEIRAQAGRNRLDLQPLSPDAVAALLERLDRGPVAEAFARACHAATGGNPFLIEELVRTLLSDDVPFTTAAAEHISAVAPSTVADAVAATLARIGPQPASLARAAAVLGDGAALDLAAELAGLPIAGAAPAAGDLVRAGLMQDVRELRFRHPILAGAVTATMSVHEQAAAHAAAASLLRARGAGPERVALQLLHTPPGADAAVVAELRLAAEHATDRGALATAAGLLERALAEPPDASLRGEVLLELGRAEQATGRSSAAFSHLEDAHRCAADPRTRAQAITLLGASLGDPGHRRRIADMAEAALPEIEALDADLALLLGGILALEGRGGALPELTGATAAEASMLGHLVFVRMVPGARAAEVGDLARRAANQVDALLAERGSPLPFVGMVLGLRWSHQLDEAERLTNRAIAAARRRGSPTDFASFMALRALVRRSAGRLHDAEADARSALAAQLDPDWLFASGIVPLTLALVDQGRPDEALTEFAAIVTGEIPEGPPMLALVLARMTARAARREHAAALADWEEALRRAQPRGPSAGWIEDLAVIADVHAATSDREGAEALAMRATQLAEDWGTPGARGQALHVQARVNGGDESIELLRRAVELLGESPMRLEEARALVSLGAALRRAGHRVDSRVPLREGYELAQQCGADGLAETARSELRASGIRLRREQATGADALTPSERRIADMAAAGLSNPEIAQELFLTVKTIEMHLTRAYRKLDIRRRAELTAALGM